MPFPPLCLPGHNNAFRIGSGQPQNDFGLFLCVRVDFFRAQASLSSVGSNIHFSVCLMQALMSDR